MGLRALFRAGPALAILLTMVVLAQGMDEESAGIATQLSGRPTLEQARFCSNQAASITQAAVSRVCRISLEKGVEVPACKGDQRIFVENAVDFVTRGVGAGMCAAVCNSGVRKAILKSGETLGPLLRANMINGVVGGVVGGLSIAGAITAVNTESRRRAIAGLEAHPYAVASRYDEATPEGMRAAMNDPDLVMPRDTLDKRAIQSVATATASGVTSGVFSSLEVLGRVRPRPIVYNGIAGIIGGLAGMTVAEMYKSTASASEQRWRDDPSRRAASMEMAPPLSSQFGAMAFSGIVTGMVMQGIAVPVPTARVPITTKLEHMRSTGTASPQTTGDGGIKPHVTMAAQRLGMLSSYLHGGVGRGSNGVGFGVGSTGHKAARQAGLSDHLYDLGDIEVAEPEFTGGFAMYKALGDIHRRKQQRDDEIQWRHSFLDEKGNLSPIKPSGWDDLADVYRESDWADPEHVATDLDNPSRGVEGGRPARDLIDQDPKYSY